MKGSLVFPPKSTTLGLFFFRMFGLLLRFSVSTHSVPSCFMKWSVSSLPSWEPPFFLPTFGGKRAEFQLELRARFCLVLTIFRSKADLALRRVIRSWLYWEKKNLHFVNNSRLAIVPWISEQKIKTGCIFITCWVYSRLKHCWSFSWKGQTELIITM